MGRQAPPGQLSPRGGSRAVLFPRLGSPTLPHTRAETRPLDLKLSWAPRAAMPVSAFLPPNFGNTVLSPSDPHQRRRWRFSHTLSSRKMLSRGPGWVRPTPPGEGGNPKEHPQPVPLRVSAPDRVFPSRGPWGCRWKLEEEEDQGMGSRQPKRRGEERKERRAKKEESAGRSLAPRASARRGWSPAR